MRLLAIAGAVLLGALLILVGAFGARWFAPSGDHADAPVELVDTAAGQAASAPFEAHLDVKALSELLAVAGASQRARILDSEESFAAFVQQETLNQSVLAAAYANGADRNEAIQVLMQRAGQRVLAETYLNQVVQSNLDPAFPSDEQVREAYDKNPDAFRVPKRMHLWQIFLAIPPDADAAARQQTTELATRIARDLKAGKATFEAMAKKYSAHQQSRLNDGYMGLIKVTDLLAPVATVANRLELGGISEPIATEGGLHIIKRGQVVDEEMLDYEAIKGQIRERLRREAALKVRQAAVDKIATEFPVETAADDVEAWRTTLRAGQGAPGNP